MWLMASRSGARSEMSFAGSPCSDAAGVGTRSCPAGGVAVASTMRSARHEFGNAK